MYHIINIARPATGMTFAKLKSYVDAHPGIGLSSAYGQWCRMYAEDPESVWLAGGYKMYFWFEHLSDAMDFAVAWHGEYVGTTDTMGGRPNNESPYIEDHRFFEREKKKRILADGVA